jgi:hypothetical protein
LIQLKIEGPSRGNGPSPEVGNTHRQTRGWKNHFGLDPILTKNGKSRLSKMNSLSHLAPIDPSTPLTLIQNATTQANDAITSSNPLLTAKWIGIILLIIVVFVIISWVCKSYSSSVSYSFNSVSSNAQSESRLLTTPPVPTYTSQLTRATDDCAGHMIFTVVETNPTLQDADSSLTYPTNVYRNKNAILTNPVITITAGDNVYKTGGSFGFIGTNELIWLTLARTDLPAELLTVPGPWTIKADFISKHSEDRARMSSSVVDNGFLDSTFDDVQDYCPFAAWRS